MSADVALLAAALATAWTVVWTALRGRPLGGLALAATWVVGLASAIAMGAIWKERPGAHERVVPEERIENRPIAIEREGSVTSDTCRACHPHHYDTWRASHHRTMTQVPSEESVVADFDDAVVRYFGREFRFYREGEGYFMEMKRPRSDVAGRPATRESFELVLSTGAHHQQAFWFASERGRSLGKLPLIWLEAERRWVPYGSIFVAPPSRPNMGVGLWNRGCIQCHVVGGRPRPEPEVGHDSQVTEFGISCEACHGAGADHAARYRNPLHRYREYFSSRDEPTLVNAADLSHDRSSQVCGQCHSVFGLRNAEEQQAYDRDGFVYRPGDDLHASRHVFRHAQPRDHPVVASKLDDSPRFYERRFWSDGMVRVSGREYNGLLETPCFQRGTLSCLSCHSMHSHPGDRRPRAEWADDQLRSGMRTNEACVQCHDEYTSADRLVAHTHHTPGSAGSSCYNCHMPHTTLGLMKAIRSHTIDSPSVATTVETGRPNACNLCHLDETLAWASEHLSDWYGISPPELDDEEKTVAASVRWLLQGDAGQRAIVGWHYGWEPAQHASGTDWMAAHLSELLTDSYDVVRFIGYHSLVELPGFEAFDYDYVGSEVARNVSRLEALDVWRKHGGRPSPSTALLIDRAGALMADESARMRQRRLDPPVILSE